MSTTNNKTAACFHADHTQSALAMIWTFQIGNPDWGEKFASLLDQRLKQMLPERCLWEILQGQESEIRQRAALMLLGWFLKGNKQLQRATELDDLAEVANQIQRSINAALRVSMYKVRTLMVRDLKRFTQFNDKKHSAQCIHPALHKNTWELPFEAQRSLLLLLLEDAESTRAIAPSHAGMVRRMVDHSMTQADIAKELGISRPAVNQRIKGVGAAIAKSLEKAEFPIA